MTSKKISLCSFCLLLFSSPLLAANYQQLSSVAGTTTSTLIIPALGNYSIRVVQLQGSSDKAGSVFSMQAGTNAYYILQNQAAGTTITVNQTNGLAASGDRLVISKADGSTNFTTTVSSISNTNLVLAVASFATTNSPPDSVYKMAAAFTFPIGALSNVVQNGEAVFTSPPGRPVTIIVDGTSWSKVDRCVFVYE